MASGLCVCSLFFHQCMSSSFERGSQKKKKKDAKIRLPSLYFSGCTGTVGNHVKNGVTWLIPGSEPWETFPGQAGREAHCQQGACRALGTASAQGEWGADMQPECQRGGKPPRLLLRTWKDMQGLLQQKGGWKKHKPEENSASCQWARRTVVYQPFYFHSVSFLVVLFQEKLDKACVWN